MSQTSKTSRPAILTVKTARASLVALISDEQIETFKPAARTLADAGNEVTFKLLKVGGEITVRAHDVEIISALAAVRNDRRWRDERIISARCVRNYMGEVVVWLMVDAGRGKGFVLAFNAATNFLTACTSAPLATRDNGRYMWSFKRIKEISHETGGSGEDAAFVTDWIDL